MGNRLLRRQWLMASSSQSNLQGNALLVETQHAQGGSAIIDGRFQQPASLARRNYSF
jgi:hypothetical protein